MSVKTPNRYQVGSVHVLLGRSYDKLGTGAAAATSDEIKYTYTITNNGLLDLFDIGIEDNTLHDNGVTITCTDVDAQTADGVGHGSFTGLATYPDKGLAPATSLTCTATDGVTQSEVRKRCGSKYQRCTPSQRIKHRAPRSHCSSPTKGTPLQLDLLSMSLDDFQASPLFNSEVPRGNLSSASNIEDQVFSTSSK